MTAATGQPAWIILPRLVSTSRMRWIWGRLLRRNYSGNRRLSFMIFIKYIEERKCISGDNE